ncbi:MAG: peptidylprolyl isomerase [Oscillospiraceae bacterium]|nr:peptidylprolyl isomerase [Oscillospiraceae bacterium]
MWKDRILAAVMAVVVTAAGTAAVARFSPDKPQFTPGQIEEGITYEVTGVPSDEIVALVDGNGAEAELFTYWLGDTCSNLQSYYSINVAENWDTAVSDGSTLREFIREDVFSAIKQQLVMENLAGKYGVTLSQEVENGLAEARENNIELLGEDGYRAAIYQLGLSEAGYDRVVRMYALNRALYDAYNTPGSELYASDDVLHTWAVGVGYITADHILIPTVDLATRGRLSDEEIAANRALAEDLLARLRASDDPAALFKELADAYSQDTGRALNPDGYTFTHGTMVASFDDAARALGEGEISGIVESEYGYHIILRKPLDVAAAADAVRDEYFNVLIGAEVENAEMELSPAAERFDVAALYDALTAAQSVENEG